MRPASPFGCDGGAGAGGRGPAPRMATSGREVRRVAYPPPPDRTSLAFYRVEDLDGALLRELCRRGLQPPLRDRMAGSVSEALPEDQLSPEHWSYLEVSPDLEVYRWSWARRTPVVFDRPLGAGAYLLHVVGHRPSRGEAEPVRFLLDEAGLAAEEQLPPGRFHLCFQVSWPGHDGAPRLAVEHPLWSTGAPGDLSRRTLSFLLYGAWLTPMGEGATVQEACHEGARRSARSNPPPPGRSSLQHRERAAQ